MESGNTQTAILKEIAEEQMRLYPEMYDKKNGGQ